MDFSSPTVTKHPTKPFGPTLFPKLFPKLFPDLGLGLILALAVLLLLQFTGTEDRGFIYVDF